MRTLFRFIGLLFFILLAVLGAGLVLAFFDLSGVHSKPVLIDRPPFQPPDLAVIKTLVSGGGVRIERSDPLDGRPLPELSPPASLPATAAPPPPPAPPLEPASYRAEVTLRAKTFAGALEAFLKTNQRLAQDESLVDDSEWRGEIEVVLGQVAAAGRALGQVGPPPPEYGAVQAWLERVGPEADGLQRDYRQALETGSPPDYRAAGEHFTRIQEILGQALAEMARAGWPLK